MAEHYPIAHPAVDPVEHHITQYVPHYATCHSRVVAAGKKGRAPGELNWPFGVAIHEEAHQIFVANFWSHRVEIFSETGEFLYQLGVGQLYRPWGIAIHGDSVYVSCWGDHTVSKFSLTELCRVRKIGGRGYNNGQFKVPRQITTNHIGLVFIADSGNDRICIHDPDLNHLRNITHQSMSRPYDVKVSRDRLYVLCPNNYPCLHVLSLEGDKQHSHYLWRRNGCVTPLLLLFGSSQQLCHQLLQVSLNSCLLSRRQSPTHDRKRGTQTRNVLLS